MTAAQLLHEPDASVCIFYFLSQSGQSESNEVKSKAFTGVIEQRQRWNMMRSSTF